MGRRTLFYGDNLKITSKHLGDETIDLVYLDPPFNSNMAYNVIFESGGEVDRTAAQLEAFTDTWTWISPETDDLYRDLIHGAVPDRVATALAAMFGLLDKSPLMAYLVMMSPRLVELHRVLKPTGSIYLHCDPTASHYLKIVMDAVFGPKCFRNEIVWRRTGAHGPRKSFGPIHDVILFYSKNPSGYFFQVTRRPYMRGHVLQRYRKMPDGRLKFVTGGNILTGAGLRRGESGMPWKGFNPTKRNRHWAIPGDLAEQMPVGFEDLRTLAKLDALLEAGLIEIVPGGTWPLPVRYLKPGDGQPIPDIWAYQPYTEGTVQGIEEGIDHDVQWLGPTDPERLGYQTQKPEGVLRRIIAASCPPDGVVLDPFCGCGTTVAVAEAMGRPWIGIDIAYIAIDIMVERLTNTFGDGLKIDFHGIPTDIDGARALFSESDFEFERWAVSEIQGQPKEKRGGDEGVDGVVRFPLDSKTAVGRAIVSVKGGQSRNPGMVRDLVGTVENHKAQLGILLTLERPTDGMVKEANKAGAYTWPVNGTSYPRIQILSAEQLTRGVRPRMPPPLPPYQKAGRFRVKADQLTIDG